MVVFWGNTRAIKSSNTPHIAVVPSGFVFTSNDWHRLLLPSTTQRGAVNERDDQLVDAAAVSGEMLRSTVGWGAPGAKRKQPGRMIIDRRHT